MKVAKHISKDDILNIHGENIRYFVPERNSSDAIAVSVTPTNDPKHICCVRICVNHFFKSENFQILQKRF